MVPVSTKVTLPRLYGGVLSARSARYRFNGKPLPVMSQPVPAALFSARYGMSVMISFSSWWSSSMFLFQYRNFRREYKKQEKVKPDRLYMVGDILYGFQEAHIDISIYLCMGGWDRKWTSRPCLFVLYLSMYQDWMIYVYINIAWNDMLPSRQNLDQKTIIETIQRASSPHKISCRPNWWIFMLFFLLRIWDKPQRSTRYNAGPWSYI
jgi:hypothetical protein